MDEMDDGAKRRTNPPQKCLKTEHIMRLPPRCRTESIVDMFVGGRS